MSGIMRYYVTIPNQVCNDLACLGIPMTTLLKESAAREHRWQSGSLIAQFGSTFDQSRFELSVYKRLAGAATGRLRALCEEYNEQFGVL